MTIGEMTEKANKRMLGFDLEMLADTYAEMWVDFFHNRRNTSLNNCAQMYILGLAMDKFDSNRSEDMRAGARLFANDMGYTAQEFQDELENVLYNIDKQPKEK